MRILYDSKSSFHKEHFGCLYPNRKCRVSLCIPVSCNATAVRLLTECGRSFELKKSCTAEAYDTFCGDICFETTGLYFYFFRIEAPDGCFDLFREGAEDTSMSFGEMWQVSCVPEDFETPEDFKGKVYYQIFPDRFYSEGSPSLEGKLTPFTLHDDTHDVPDYLPDSRGEILNNDFFGGNLKGIENKLPYIKEMGAGIIYLNPIFKAFSNHRYDTCDYRTVDEMLGTKEDFVSLCKSAHELGIKVILDGVFSHTGSDSIYFDAKKRFGTGVISNPGSPYKDWYTKRDDGKFESWWGIETLPCVNELCESYLDYIIRSEDSIIKHWLSLGCDGFRLDVADELPDEFIRLLRSEVKKVRPDAIVIGEVWEDASNKISYGIRRSYFTGAELDSVMNYPFRSAIIDLCTERISAKDFCTGVTTVTENYPKQVLDCLMNCLSTHDTPRIMTVLSDAPLNLTRIECAAYKLSAEQVQRAFERIYPAVFLQFFLPGCASVYYGDEIGTFGFGDPFNRGCFDWSGTDCALRDFYRQMAEIKNSFPVFSDGKLYIKARESTLYMERYNETERLCAVINMGNEPARIYAKDLIISHNATIAKNSIYIQKHGFVIFI